MIILYTVYPRWRGEHAVMAIGHAAGGGLSPLARGTPNGSDVRRLRYRFIPAGAGNTATRCSNEPFDPVYPRWRGEHSTTAEGMKNLGGLSPLARGTLSLRSGRRLRNRFIPAGAGNTVFRTSRGLLGPVYPRWRGEHLLWRWRTEYRCGLSPLARGTQINAVFVAFTGRFIPAGAGNTCADRPASQLHSVYPRWRGEHSQRPASRTKSGGLSPLARGTRPPSGRRKRASRFIPAGAGNTHNDMAKCAGARGLSPLARGTRRSSLRPAVLTTVYPRWRGEHTPSTEQAAQKAGLSPLARGTLAYAVLLVSLNRFIPAGAGNTQRADESD